MKIVLGIFVIAIVALAILANYAIGYLDFEGED